MTYLGPGTWQPQPQPHAMPPSPFGDPPRGYRQPQGVPSWGWGGPPPPGAGPPPPPYGWQPQPPRRARWKWIVPVVVAVVAIASALGVWGYLRHQAEQVRNDIRTTVTAFAEASDTADTKKLASMMCPAEAEQFLDGYEGQDDEGPITPAERRPVDIGAITVEGDDATVDVTRAPSPTVTLKLTRIDETWKLCNPS